MDNNQIQKRGYTHAEAATVIGNETVLNDMVAAGWLKPIVKRHKLRLYTVESLDTAFERLVTGEYPRKSKGV